ncbi:MAG: imidazole glycerol phosphate synthase cyclase subunit [Desulfobacula sp.]|uniref:imidazole glycerol phosphate synthase subunit HisF n=1 Tax=Desulfobacula sp. TaxID=2593537 RepID=UPI0025BA50E2|nr:imidazole glycerol phosphate synthase cyclase subunit [Desulfobacula sp.]MCD4722143.1 imidazole glycerol phosphate synthase cyclase subunit [Desulfobacula sp.]
MLKKRIIPKFLLKEGRLIKGVKFHDNHRESGNPVSTAKVYDSYGVDELVFLDILASVESRKTMLEVIKSVSEEVFMPLTVGGGVKSLNDARDLLFVGADKISINTAAVEKPYFIKEAAKYYGDQCIVGSVDYKEIAPNTFRVFTHGGNKKTELDPIEWSMQLQDFHCGEIMLTSIDLDGTMSGYDIEMIQKLSRKLTIPLIASSGAGCLDDCCFAFQAGADAITISSMFFFTDHSPIKVRSYLSSKGINVRASKSSRN